MPDDIVPTIQVLTEAAQHTSIWEWLAVLSGIAYLLLAMRENNGCWYFAFVSTLIYTLLFWDVSLLMDSALNVFYMGMAVYGWWYWQWGGEVHSQAVIRRWSRRTHGLALLGVVLASVLSGYFLSCYTDAAWPYMDSFTTWASALTTWMVAQKILENWLYWFVIDSISVFLYLDRGLYLTALLFVIYIVMVVFGYFSWRKHYRARQSFDHAEG